jgi:hypothetical protein
MAQSASYSFHAGTTMHQVCRDMFCDIKSSTIDILKIFARFRLAPEYGGDANLFTFVTIVNDTGSNIQTIFTSDLQTLNYNQNTYRGNLGNEHIFTPAGPVHRALIRIQIQLADANGMEMTPWLLETAVITPSQLGLPRLSGLALCNSVYFATAPGNTTLYVAVKKNGIVSQLPVV